MEAELRLGLPIIFGSSKMRSVGKKRWSKGPNLWVVKEVKDDGTVDIEKIVLRRMIQPTLHPLWINCSSSLGR